MWKLRMASQLSPLGVFPAAPYRLAAAGVENATFGSRQKGASFGYPKVVAHQILQVSWANTTQTQGSAPGGQVCAVGIR
jgi:hypothetical protein